MRDPKKIYEKFEEEKVLTKDFIESLSLNALNVLNALNALKGNWNGEALSF